MTKQCLVPLERNTRNSSHVVEAGVVQRHVAGRAKNRHATNVPSCVNGAVPNVSWVLVHLSPYANATRAR